MGYGIGGLVCWWVRGIGKLSIEGFTAHAASSVLGFHICSICSIPLFVDIPRIPEELTWLYKAWVNL